MTEKISIFNLNIQWFTNFNNRKEKIIQIIKKLNPDIITFQELRINNKTNENLLDILNKKLWYKYQHFQSCFNYSK